MNGTIWKEGKPRIIGETNDEQDMEMGLKMKYGKNNAGYIYFSPPFIFGSYFIAVFLFFSYFVGAENKAADV